MKAIITYIPGLSRDQIRTRRNELVARRDKLVSILASNIERHNARSSEHGAEIWHTPVSASEKDSLLAGKKHTGGFNNPWISTSREIDKLNQQIKSHDPKPHPASVKIAVVDSYSAKDALKSRLYRFDRDGHWVDFLGMRTKTAWCREIIVDENTSINRIIEELDFLRALGCAIEDNNLPNTLTEQVKRGISGGSNGLEMLTHVPY